MKVPFVCFNRKSLESILPHRGEALRKIDGVFYSADSPNSMIGIKRISSDDKDLEGHFPDAPLYPGYAQDEFICLVAAALIPAAIESLPKNPQVVQKIARYKNTAQPGDTLTATVRFDGRRNRFFMFSGEIRKQDNTVVAEYEKIVGAL